MREVAFNGKNGHNSDSNLDPQWAPTLLRPTMPERMERNSSKHNQGSETTSFRIHDVYLVGCFFVCSHKQGIIHLSHVAHLDYQQTFCAVKY